MINCTVKSVNSLKELMSVTYVPQRTVALSAHMANVPLPKDHLFYYVNGWHFYTYLRFTQDIERASNHWQAQKQMSILKNYCAVANLAAKYFPFAKLLEVQGDVHHFFLELDNSAASLEQIKRFARYQTSMIEAKVKPLAPDDFQQYHQAADYGRSVLINVPSLEAASVSIISLGDCANRPAKQMGKSEDNIRRPLWIPTEYVSDGDARTTWTALETLRDSVCGNKREESQSDDTEAFQAELRNMTMRALGQQGTSSRLVLCHAQPLREPYEQPATPDDPEIIDAFLCRADLDGFTAQVREAFGLGPDAIKALVLRFVKLTHYVQALKEKADFTVVDLSWSGDCANFVVKVPEGETYKTGAKFLPPKIAKLWHGLLDERINGDGTWRDVMHGIGWVLCPAGGRLFLADLHADERKFRVASGWPTGSSRDGVNRDGTRPGWTVMHRENVQELKQDAQDIFKELDSDFKYVPFDEIQRYGHQSVAAAAAGAGASVFHYGAKTVSIPRVLPYAEVR